MKLSAVIVLGHAAVATALAQTPGIDYGRAEYVNNCAACHGDGGTGDGHFRLFLNRKPADLTTLARENGGVFPALRVFEAIDGRRGVSGHGEAGEMPIWGSTYMAQARYDPAIPPGAAEAYARARISLLVDYLYRIQSRRP